jgi:hypothetical protein
MKIKANWFMQLEHPESPSPNPASIPGSCWYCGFLPEEASKKEEKEEAKKNKQCTKCGMWTLQNPSDPILLTDPSVQDGPMESSVVVNVSHVRQAADFSKGLTPDSINQLKTDLQYLGLPLDKIGTITRILDDHRALVQQQQQQMTQRQQTQTYEMQSYPTMKPPGARIKAADIVKEELKNKIEEVVDQLVEKGADEDDAREMIKALVDKELDVSAAIDKMAVWAEPIVEHDYTPPLAESSKKPRKVIKRKKRK